MRRAVLMGTARLIDCLPPRLTIPLYTRWRLGEWPKKRPKTYTEKLQAAKFRPVSAEMARLADKVGVKDIVAERLGPDWVVPTLYAGTSLPPIEDRNWPIPFVIKASHGSGWNIFVRRPPDWSVIDAQLERWLRTRRFRFIGENHYRLICPRVIVEPMIAGHEFPTDYKVFVFGEVASFVQVDTGRYGTHVRAYYDRNWVKQPFHRHHPLDPEDRPRPQSLHRILDASEKMAAGFDFVRVDFYEVAGRPLFGEATFFPGSGFQQFKPREFESRIGELWPWPTER